MPASFLVHDAAVQGPATHALVIGVGAYAHLSGGVGRLSNQHDGMGQLTSPPLSARAFASWLMTEFKHPDKPLGTVALLLSEAVPAPFVAPNEPEKRFDVPAANSANVRSAAEHLFRRGNEHASNLLIFYFCGHGIATGTDTALLLSDYGANDLNALDGAIDFRRLRLGMGRCKASEQCYFVDACRASTDTLIEALGHAGQVVIGGGLREPGLPPRRAPVLYATMNGFKAFAIPGRPTIFTDALLQALRDLAADDEHGDWRVSTSRIQAAVEHVSERQALGVGKQQVPTGDDVANIHINFLARTPTALVYVKSEPADAIDEASLSYKLAGAAEPLPASPERRNGKEWVLELPAGSYDFKMTFEAGPPCVVANSVRPAFRTVTMKVPP
jgi:Caspase domain